MKPLLQLPESERKNIFWISFIAVAGIIIVFWALVFFRNDIERFQGIPLPDASGPEFSEELGSLKELRKAFKENVAAFQSLSNDIKSLGQDLTKEEELKLDEWGHAKEAEGKEPTFEEILEFLRKLRGTETTMPSKSQ